MKNTKDYARVSFKLAYAVVREIYRNSQNDEILFSRLEQAKPYCPGIEAAAQALDNRQGTDIALFFSGNPHTSLWDRMVAAQAHIRRY